MDKLKNIIREMGNILIAYSGGVDSTFLLKVAKETLPDKVTAVVARSETYPSRETEFSLSTAEEYGVPVIVIDTKEMNNKNFYNNPEDRCYWCKHELFSKISRIAKEKNIPFVAEGSNYDDLSDYRPGFKAADELGIRKPLLEAGMTKEEIRILSKEMGLKTWNKPSFACLASRFPYGTKINEKDLRNINKAEEFIISLGIIQVRVRHFGKTARIDVMDEDIPVLVEERRRVSMFFKDMGYTAVTLNIEGYKSGNMNLLRDKMAD